MTKKQIVDRIIGNAGKSDQFKPTTMAIAFVMAVINQAEK